MRITDANRRLTFPSRRTTACGSSTAGLWTRRVTSGKVIAELPPNPIRRRLPPRRLAFSPSGRQIDGRHLFAFVARNVSNLIVRAYQDLRGSGGTWITCSTFIECRFRIETESDAGCVINRRRPSRVGGHTETDIRECDPRFHDIWAGADYSDLRFRLIRLDSSIGVTAVFPGLAKFLQDPFPAPRCAGKLACLQRDLEHPLSAAIHFRPWRGGADLPGALRFVVPMIAVTSISGAGPSLPVRARPPCMRHAIDPRERGRLLFEPRSSLRWTWPRCSPL